MKHQEISEKHQKWIIQFYSDKYEKPVYFIWLTDSSGEEKQDQILLTKSDKIFAAKSKRKLIQGLIASQLKMPDSKQTKKWLEKSLNCKKISSVKYDLRKIGTKILANELREQEIEGIINFVNLYEDYKVQIGNGKSRTKRLNKIWHYYYEEIFFPNLKRTNQEKFNPSKLKIDNKKLFKEVAKMLMEFENKFELV